ncbi:NYN domain-containing protein [Trinickia caryophylli]|uniref:TIGR00288 family protein n=1 Tax=Trinickia caryophylli TaxID=28094 RepID=A0A1X7FU26_TRICW|nr:NYN domain-containing protein [Trinickia caryophylli]WQE13853.1 NYN domain-containing protein [Trinickia caryophylli]SMF58628.1 TIGR00288 family protein [Trinickia caryophylli]
MASPHDSVSMALFCDFENVALGVRDAKYEKFDIKPVLERLLLKGSIVVKKAYCDWDRYKTFKSAMHEASFELIEIPHVRQSGKNSADIRLVVDALDLCYTKSHVDTFVIISGDSDFSPLVSKLRENEKKVIGVGVKNSTSDLLVANCDEFIFYDDLVREQQRAMAKREARDAANAPKRPAEEEKQPKMEARKAQAIALAVETFEALVSERGDSGKIWASVLKSAIKRRKPDFNESYYGFRAFGNLLDEAQSRGLLEVGRDDKSGAFVYRPAPASIPPVEPVKASATPPAAEAREPEAVGEQANGKHRRKGRSARKQAAQQAPLFAEMPPAPQEPAIVAGQTRGEPTPERQTEIAETAAQADALQAPAPASAPRRARKTAPRKKAGVAAQPVPSEEMGGNEPSPAIPVTEAPAAKPPRKSGARSSRPRKTPASDQ